MAEVRHPGDRTYEPPDDPTLPLRVVKVYPPSHLDVAQAASRMDPSATGLYVVHLGLSRRVTDEEKTAADRMNQTKDTSRVRVYGSTLEITNTSIELIAKNADAISKRVREIETEGRKITETLDAQAEALRVAREGHEDEAARLAKLAQEIKFD